MKTIKLLGIALATAAMASCSTDVDFTPDEKDYPVNTAANVTVSMDETVVTVVENVGVFTVPMTLEGDANGYVNVKVECVETGNNPAMPDADYFMTNDDRKGNTAWVRIDKESKVGAIEFRTVDRRGEDPTRQFIVRLVSAEGAQINGLNETLVSIVDKGPSPKYNELAGKWIMSGMRANFDTGNVDVEFMAEVRMTTPAADESYVEISGIPGESTNYSMRLTWDYDEEEKWGQLVLPAETFGGTYGPYELQWETSGGAPIPGRWNATYTSATFGNSDTQIGLTAYANGSAVGTMDVITGFTLTRVQN